MKKALSAFSIVAIFLFMLFSCGKQEIFSPRVTVADGYSVEGNVISAVFYNTPSIDIYSDVTFSDGASRLYSDETYTEYLSDGLLDLDEGLNTFYFLVTKGARSVSYTLNITNYTISSLRISENYTKKYASGEGFDRGSITVFGVLKSGGETEIKDYSLTYDFSSEGKREVLIECGGISYTLAVNVDGKITPKLDEQRRDSFGVKYTLRDGEAVIVDGSGAEGYFSASGEVFYNGKSFIVSKIADRAFENNSKISSLTIPENIAVGENAFSGCTALRSVSLRQGVTIGVYSFSGCSQLENVELPRDMTEIPDGAFSGCGKIKNVDFPSTLKSVGAHAFLDCVSLESIDLHDGIEKIGARAFKGCASVSEIVCGASLKKLGYGAFSYCTGLTLIIIPEFVESDDGLLDGCPDVTLCSGPTSIAIYYAKRAGINTVSVKDGTICLLDLPEVFSLGDEIRADSVRLVASENGRFGVVEHFGLNYDFSVPGKRTVTATYNGMSTSIDVFVRYEDFLLGGKDSYGAEYDIDYEKNVAYLSRLPDSYSKDTFVLPTHIDVDGVIFKVKGLYNGAIRDNKLKKLILHSEVNLIDDNAVCDCPDLSVVLCGVRQGTYLKIGNGNFKGLSDDLVILCELKNSSMQIFARSAGIHYAKAEANSLYMGAGKDAKTRYLTGEDFVPDNFYVILIDENYSVTPISTDEVEFRYDFSQDANVECIYGQYRATYTVDVTKQ